MLGQIVKCRYYCIFSRYNVLSNGRIDLCVFRTLSSFPPSYESIFNKAIKYGDRTAVVDTEGSHSFDSILQRSRVLEQVLKNTIGTSTKEQRRIAFLTPSSSNSVVCQWAVWLSGNVTVPLYNRLNENILEYYVKDSGSSAILVTRPFKNMVLGISDRLGVPLITIEDVISSSRETLSEPDKLLQEEWQRLKRKDAQILYTSGTTGPPKGVVATHHNIFVQCAAISEMWELNASDIVLNALPLHHTHGITVALNVPLYAGAAVHLLPRFDAKTVWELFLDRGMKTNVFMGVPSMYALLIDYYDKHYANKGPRTRQFITATLQQKFRVMISGSASLPITVLERWREISGHTLLERYGMTEIGMALTNPLHGLRRPGFVGTPFPGVSVCIAKPNAYTRTTGYDPIVIGDSYGSKGQEGISGDLLIKGPSVFRTYHNRPRETEESFTPDGWFKTGDTAMFENGSYRLLGRTSADIIKSGGYKISALDVERILLMHPRIADISVVGLPDITWGQKVACAAVFTPGAPLTLGDIREFAKDKLSSAEIPSVLEIVSEIPRNVLGKVNKVELVKTLFAKQSAA